MGCDRKGNFFISFCLIIFLQSIIIFFLIQAIPDIPRGWVGGRGGERVMGFPWFEPGRGVGKPTPISTMLAPQCSAVNYRFCVQGVASLFFYGTFHGLLTVLCTSK